MEMYEPEMLKNCVKEFVSLARMHVLRTIRVLVEGESLHYKDATSKSFIELIDKENFHVIASVMESEFLQDLKTAFALKTTEQIMDVISESTG